MSYVKTEAVVLRKRSLPNADILITFFTHKNGKMHVLAKGIKKITSRRLPHTETGNLVNAMIREHNNRWYLEQTELISAFSHIKQSEKKVQLMYFFFFVLERLLPENQTDEQVFVLVKKFLIALSRAVRLQPLFLQNYLNILLHHLGYIENAQAIDKLLLTIEEIIHEKVPQLVI